MPIALTDTFEVLDERFRKLALANVHLERLHTGCRWAEGPAWFPAGRYLLWSDIPNDRLLRWDETDGSVSVFRQPSLNTNGNTVDLEGRLVSCEHRGRYEGKRFNSPNDVVVKSDGSIWFTDPSYGIDSDYEGDAAPSELGACCVYRIAPDLESVTRVADDFVQPNGLAFSPDERWLYVVDTGATHVEDGPRHIRRLRVQDGGATLTGGEVFAESTAGLFDGLRVDVHGNLWTSAADGVHCYAADGTLLGKVRVPEVVANVCFGGAKGNRLFVCATTGVYAVYLNTRGAVRPGA